ncbi:MAG: radical SAM protein [Clostridia bacterium]|nr:radical SAM protein [Clostridia bacterium]
MHFASGINRPPYETADGYLQTTEGCSHNTCLFCTYFKDQKFRKSTIEEIEADIKEIPRYFGAPKRIFLQGADGFAADYDVLMKTAELLHQYVPSVQTIGGYARIDNFYDKTEQQLRNMAAVGYADPYIGVESGDDVVLKRINKGYTAAQAREVLEKIDASGLPFIVNFLNGAGGHGYGLKNARKTAALYADLHPTMVNTSMLTVVPGTPLYRAVEKGMYVESTEMEKLEEVHELVRCLNNDTIFMNEHASNLFHVMCRIPEQKEELLAYIQKFIESKDERELRQYREQITRAFR